jgi:homoserine dehydrogenase
MQDLDDLKSRYYLRFEAQNAPGVLAEISGAHGAQGVSIQEMVQEDRAESAIVLMLTHRCREGALRRALAQLSGSTKLIGQPRFIRIEDV